MALPSKEQVISSQNLWLERIAEASKQTPGSRWVAPDRDYLNLFWHVIMFAPGSEVFVYCEVAGTDKKWCAVEQLDNSDPDTKKGQGRDDPPSQKQLDSSLHLTNLIWEMFHEEVLTTGIQKRSHNRTTQVVVVL